MPTHRALHVAAMPFSTYQGTQAVVRAMLDVLSAVEREVHLVTYAHGAYVPRARYAIHRVGDFPRERSLRSGPSLRKLALDARLSRLIGRVARRVRPDVVVAHHVEATAAALAAGRIARPLVFFAHTALGREIASYAPASPLPIAPLLSRAGSLVDAVLARRADCVAAIAPALRDELQGATRADVRYVPAPWPVPAPIEPEERERARERLALAPGDDALLYAGNLDRYQGLDVVLRALVSIRKRRAGARFIVATASQPGALLDEARALGVADAIVVASIEGEEARRAVHAAADVAIVPRRAPGGLPIKLLDALARGVPTVAAARATAGLDLRGAAIIVEDDDADAMAAGLLATLGARSAARELGESGRAYVRTDHAPERFVLAFDEMCEAALGRSSVRVR